MLAPILRKTAKLPADSDLTAKNATIEHVFHGNSEDVQPLLKQLADKGWRVGEWGFEVGDGFKIVDDAVGFRRIAAARVRKMCELAASNHVEYESWWVNAPEISDYVSQNADLGVVSEVHDN